MVERQMLKQVTSFFDEDGWDYQVSDELNILSMGFAGVNGKWLCYAQARETEEQFVFYSVLSVNAPEKRMMKMAEFITRVNYGMVIGNFEMDFEDGEIRYKTSVDVEGTELSSAMIRQIVYANLVITDRYLPGIMLVLYSDQSPSDILETVELEDLLDEEDEFEDDDFDDFDDDDYDDFDDDDFELGDFPPFDLPPYQSPN